MLKYISLILACCVALTVLSLPGFASNDDPYDGDSYLDIPTGTEEDPYNQNAEESAVPEVSEDPDPVVSEDPELAASEEVTDDTQTSEEEELPVDDTGSSGDAAGTDDTGTEVVPVVEVDTSGASTVYNITQTETVSRSPLLDAITALFGDYQPRTYTVTTYLEDGTAVESEEIVPGLAGLDYHWLAGVVIFMLSLFCIFRMIGGLSKWK